MGENDCEEYCACSRCGGHITESQANGVCLDCWSSTESEDYGIEEEKVNHAPGLAELTELINIGGI